MRCNALFVFTFVLQITLFALLLVFPLVICHYQALFAVISAAPVYYCACLSFSVCEKINKIPVCVVRACALVCVQQPALSFALPKLTVPANDNNNNSQAAGINCCCCRKNNKKNIKFACCGRGGLDNLACLISLKRANETPSSRLCLLFVVVLFLALQPPETTTTAIATARKGRGTHGERKGREPLTG